MLVDDVLINYKDAIPYLDQEIIVLVGDHSPAYRPRTMEEARRFAEWFGLYDNGVTPKIYAEQR